MYVGGAAALGNGKRTGGEIHPDLSGIAKASRIGGDRCRILGEGVVRPGICAGLSSNPVSVSKTYPETASLSFSVNRFLNLECITTGHRTRKTSR